MNILYGVSGEGFGHASHAIEISRALVKNGHKVVIITYDRAYEVLKDKFEVMEVKGINLIYKKGKMRYMRSVLFNLWNLSKNIPKIGKIIRLMSSFKPDVCITDMEPFVPLLAHIYRIPLISISNQNRFTRFEIKPGKYKKDYLIAKIAIAATMPFADKYIALSLSKIKAKAKNSVLVGPIIKKDIREAKAKVKDFVVVYLSKENEPVIDMLRTIDENFKVYGYNIKKTEGNLEFKKKESFLKDFSECKAIISTAGFTSIGEAVYLKKPYLAVPLKGQFEQIYNSIFLNEKGMGYYSENLNREEIVNFLSNLDVYRKNIANYKMGLKEPVKELLKSIKEFR